MRAFESTVPPALLAGCGGGGAALQDLHGSHRSHGSQGFCCGSGLSAGEQGNDESEPKNFSISSDCFNLSQIGVKLP